MMKRSTYVAKIGVPALIVLAVTLGIVLEGCAKKNQSSNSPATIAPSALAGSGSAVSIATPSSSTYLSNGNSVNVAGACAPGAALSIEGDVAVGDMINPSNSLSSTCANDGTFSLDIGKASDATFNIIVHQTSINDTSASVAWTRDATAPAQPVISAPSATPYASNQNSVLITASCEIGATVILSGDDSQSAACSSGSVDFNVPKSSDNFYSLDISQADPAGNNSSSSNLVCNRDTVAPSVPVILNPAVNSITSSNATLAISGSCEPQALVVLSGADNQSFTCTGGSSFSFSVTSIVADGTYDFLVGQSDPAGNNSGQASQRWIKDSSMPSTPVITAPLASPFYSNLNSLTIAGSCTNGYSVNLSGSASGSMTCAGNAFSFNVNSAVDGNFAYNISQMNLAGTSSPDAVQNWIRDTSPPSTPVLSSPASSPHYSNLTSLTIAGSCEAGSTVMLSGPSSSNQACSGGLTFSFTETQSVDGTYNYSVSQVDLAGNASITSASAQWILDRAAPSAPTVTSPSPNPFISGDTNIVITGACEDSATVNLNGASSSSVVCASSAYSFNVSKSSDGTYNFVLAQTDRAGNASTNTNFQWVRDTSIPATPTLISPASNPYYSNGSLAGGNLNVIIGCQGTNLVTIDDGITALNAACASGQASFVVATAGEGLNNYTITQETASFISSSSLNFDWNDDRTAPVGLSILNPPTSPYTVSGNLTLSGACENFATVALSGDDAQSVACASSAYSFSIAKAVDATYNFSIMQTDLAGNISGTLNQQWIRNSTVPPAPTIASPSASPFYSNLSSLTLSGGCASGMTVILGGVLASDVTSPAGSLSQLCIAGAYSYTIAKSADATYALTVKQQDGLGNMSPNANLSWVRDTVASTVTLSTNPAAINYALDSAFTYTASASASPNSFECQLDGAVYASCVSTGISYSALSLGNHTFYIRAKDAAGNTGAATSYTWNQQGHYTVALYHLNNAAPTVDSGLYTASNTLTASATAPANEPTGKFAEARTFNSASTTNYRANDSVSLNTLANGVFTIESWVQFNSLPSNNSNRFTIAEQSSTASTATRGWAFSVTNSTGYKIRLTVYGPSSTSAVTKYSNAITIATGSGSTNWYHVAVTYNKGAYAFYLNGTQVGTGTFTTTAINNSTTQLYIGATNGGGSRKFNGDIDELRISQSIRYNGNFTPSASAFSPVPGTTD